jgi:hypothetical protein
MEDSQHYQSIDEFAASISTEWQAKLDTPKQPENISEILYHLALELADELSVNQITALPIATIRTFLLGQLQEISPEQLIHCLLTSPTDKESFATLKSVYKTPESVKAQKVIH